MATPGDLVEYAAQVLGLSPQTVAQYDRVLAENGMRSKSGRGTSAAQVTANDAANLLIAILGSPVHGRSIKDAAEICFRYRVLPILPNVSQAKEFRRFGLNSLRQLPVHHTFGDAVGALIQECAEGGYFRIPVQGGKPLKTHVERLFGIKVESDYLWAGIEADNLGELGARMVYTERPKRVGFGDSDLRQTRSVSYETIRILASVVADGLKK